MNHVKRDRLIVRLLWFILIGLISFLAGLQEWL